MKYFILSSTLFVMTTLISVLINFRYPLSRDIVSKIYNYPVIFDLLWWLLFLGAVLTYVFGLVELSRNRKMRQ